jgi:PKD repeat protein
MTCSLDSNYVLSPNLHTTLKGRYNVQVNPNTGNILGGYYIAQNVVFGNAYDVDTYHDLDENENYYETGTLIGDFGGGGDTLILANQRIAPDTSKTAVLAYIFSLDKNGNYRYIITNKSYANAAGFTSCKYDFLSDRLVACWSLDPGNIYGSDTFNFNPNNLSFGASRGLFAINPTGHILSGKYVTYSNSSTGGFFIYAPTARYLDHLINNGLVICNNVDTLFNKDTATSSANDYSGVISQGGPNGNLLTTHSMHIGVIGSGFNVIKYGAADWRGNVYLGGTFSNFIATPTDSLVNRDLQSGNFFIAKLGISDCRCPTPGAQFTQIAHGDTVYFLGSSINHRDSIHWRFGDGSSAISDTFMHVYSQNGTYNVTAIAYSGCGIDSITKQITVRNVGIAVVDPDKTNLYPNPVKNIVNLEVSGAAKIGLIFANGASVWEGPIQVNQQGTYVFDMSKYSSALYYFIVEYTNGKVDVLQVVKE